MVNETLDIMLHDAHLMELIENEPNLKENIDIIYLIKQYIAPLEGNLTAINKIGPKNLKAMYESLLLIKLKVQDKEIDKPTYAFSKNFLEDFHKMMMPPTKDPQIISIMK